MDSRKANSQLRKKRSKSLPMSTIAATATSIQKKFLSLRIPPVYYFLLVVFVVGIILDSLFARGQMTSPTILTNILVRSVALGIVAIGQTFVIIGASIDLSVAYLISVTAVMASYIMQGDPARVPLAIAVVFGIGAVVGLTNGLIVTKLKVNPFIATLGVGLVMKGLLNASFSNFAGAVPASFQTFGYGAIGPIPISVLILLGAAVIAGFILQRTRFGAHLYGVGGNKEIARLSGLRTDRVIIAAHVICSLMAVLTGLFVVSRLRSGAPWVGTDGLYDLESIAAVVVGGTALAGGRGGVAGTIAGVFIFGLLDTLFNQLGVDTFLKQVLRGSIIILAVASYTIRSRRQAS
jgi:ribose transport system permease protein